MKKFFYFIPAALLLICSCASSRSVYQLAGEWQVVNIEGNNITPSDETPFLGFDLNKSIIYGYTGCNRLNSSLDAKKFVKGEVDFSRVATTRRLCRDDKYERIFLEALNNAKSSELVDGKILLKDKDDKVIMTLKKK